MDKVNNEILLRGSNAASYGTVSGITFYKLESEFEGDTTKNCSLTSEEVDKNFYFLRGYDIESLNIDNGSLIVQRVDHDYDPIVIPIQYEDFSFDTNTGVLTVSYPNGTSLELEGFLVNSGSSSGQPVIYYGVKTDNTLIGDGTDGNLLGVSPLELTGHYSPANDYLDLTAQQSQQLSACTSGKGYRVVTKENSDNFGFMYPVSALEAIQNKLISSGSQWRIPTKEQWDTMLNSFEIPQYRNHDGLSESTTQYEYGDQAGVAHRTPNLWRYFRPNTIGQDLCGLSILPLGMKDEQSSEINGDNEKTSFWCYPDENGGPYVKTFDFSFGGVHQYLPRQGYKCAIRLIKTTNEPSVSSVENILGKNYKTTLVRSYYSDTDYKETWLAVNFADEDSTLNGITKQYGPDIESERNSIIFCVSEWDGNKWVKKEMSNGDSVVIMNEKDGKSFHEWRLINGELVDMDIDGSDIPDWSEDIASLHESVSSLTIVTRTLTNRADSLTEDLNILNDVVSGQTEEINGIDDALNSLSNMYNDLVIAIDNETDDRTEKDNELEGRINELSATTPSIANLSAITQHIENIDNTIQNIENKEVVDIEYESNLLRLKYADGATSQGFTPTDFLKDTFVCGVTLNSNNELVIDLNNGTKFKVPLSNSSYTGQYVVSEDSKSFLKINNNEIGTYVDGGGGYIKTLATTTFSESAATNALNESKSYTDSGLQALSGSILQHVDFVDNQVYQKTVENKNSIDILNGGITTTGSVIYTVYQKMDDALLTQEVINPQGITEEDTLIKKIHLPDGTFRYYVSNKANDIYITVDEEQRNLNNYIKSLNERIDTLQQQVSGLTASLDRIIKDTVYGYILGTNYEIKVNRIDQGTLAEKLQIGFADNAVFGDMNGASPANQ